MCREKDDDFVLNKGINEIKSFKEMVIKKSFK